MLPLEHGRLVQALLAAAASTIGVAMLIVTMRAWPAVADVWWIIVAIAGIAGLIGSVLKPLPWYLAALLGSVVGFVCAFGVATYAVSRI